MPSALLTGLLMLGGGAVPINAAAIALKPTYEHVFMLSVDGMHNSDLNKYIIDNPSSNFAKLLRTANRYTDCYTSAPSDSFPGTTAQISGGDPATAGIWYDDTWDSTYYPSQSAGSNCTGPAGAEVLYDESIDYNSTEVFSGGINPANLPQTLINGVCTPVYPHKRIRVNTIYEVVHAGGSETAYADKHPAYDLVRGPSGEGLTVGYFPEQAAAAFPDNVGSASINYTIDWDDYHKTAFLEWLDGTTPVNSEGNLTEVPTLMGGNFQAVSVAQKQVGYLNTTGFPLSYGVTYAIDSVDTFLGDFVAKLQANGLYENTLIVVASKHGQAPVDPNKYGKVNPSLIIPATGVNVSFVTTDDIALIWLADADDTAAATLNLARAAESLAIDKIYSGTNLTAAGFGNPATDVRVPNIIVKPREGIIYTTSTKKIAEHGGISGNDRHVACFASNPGLAAKNHTGIVYTKQWAPTVLKVLGYEPSSLQAVQAEGTKVLPGF